MMTKDKLRQLTGDERLGQMRESEYLGAEDIDDGTEPVLTIAGLWYGSVTLRSRSRRSTATVRRLDSARRTPGRKSGNRSYGVTSIFAGFATREATVSSECQDWIRSCRCITLNRWRRDSTCGLMMGTF